MDWVAEVLGYAAAEWYWAGHRDGTAAFLHADAVTVVVGGEGLVVGVCSDGESAVRRVRGNNDPTSAAKVVPAAPVAAASVAIAGSKLEFAAVVAMRRQYLALLPLRCWKW